MFRREVKASACISVVRPLMQYAGIVWDLYQTTYISSLERIQCRMLRWATLDLAVYITYWNLWNGQD